MCFQELENLLEKEIIDEDVFDQIHAALPEESPLSGPLRTANRNGASPAPSMPTTNNASPAPPTQQLSSMGLHDSHPPSPAPGPPSYDATPAPNVPSRSAKPVIAEARALYKYVASDARDVSFEKDDRIAVQEYMNQDWWMGQNVRTGQEGIFPRNYVYVEQDKGPKSYGQPQYGYPPGPPAQQNPYDANVPPMAVAEGGQGQGQEGDHKMGQYGKKFGKKLGNAAIFGAGATIGGNIVNSIF